MRPSDTRSTRIPSRASIGEERRVVAVSRLGNQVDDLAVRSMLGREPDRDTHAAITAAVADFARLFLAGECGQSRWVTKRIYLAALLDGPA